MSKLKQVFAVLVVYSLLCWYLSPAQACGYVSIEPVVITAMGVK